METTYYNGRVDVMYGQPGRGVFALDQENQKLEYLSPASARSIAEKDWTSEPGFVGEETILGYKTFHIHSETDGQSVDTYFSPDLGFPLKWISGNPRTKTVSEVTKVIFGDPAFEPAAAFP